MSKKININYVLLLIGQTISQLGSSMTSFAIVIWAYSSTGQVISSSLLAVCSAVPYLIVSLWGGTVADNVNKKKIMLVCDLIAAVGSMIIFISYSLGFLHLWILCVVNVISGFMNAFQNPASQVAVTLLIDQKDYSRIGGIQSAVGGFVGILQPILAAAVLSVGGLPMILIMDLSTFAFAFLTLLFFVNIPDEIVPDKKTPFAEMWSSLKEGISFIKTERSILMLLVMYSVLEFVGAISFDGMFSPLLLARTDNSETVVGIVSAFMAAGCMAASILLSIIKSPKKKLPVMFLGSYMCLIGITLFGMGRRLIWWCVVVFAGCFGAPVYQTYQTVIIREKVDVSMQGRVFSLQGMITGMLTPLGYFMGAVLADYVFEPFMEKIGSEINILRFLVGEGKGSGIGLIFVVAGILGIILLSVLKRSGGIRTLECDSL